jgi:hypothetical protein
MSSAMKNGSVKPCLEPLEERALPSVLLSGAVDQLAIPLNNLLADMNAAQQDLSLQLEKMKNPGPIKTTYSGVNYFAVADVDHYANAYGAATAAWQRMVNHQQAIDAMVKADMAFITAVAHAEFQNGDPIDLAILLFGKQLGLDPTAKLTNIQTQAEKMINNPTVQSQITSFNRLSLYEGQPIGYVIYNTIVPIGNAVRDPSKS